MARTFDLLRANDLVFRYVVDGWLHGRAAARVRPPGVERRQHQHAGQRRTRDFLRKMYMENALARDEYVAMGERLMMSEIGTD